MTLEVVMVAGLAIAGAVTAWRIGPIRRTSARGERGAADNSFMKKVVKVSLIVMLVAGGTVWLLDRAEDNPPDTGSEQRRPDRGGRN